MRKKSADDILGIAKYKEPTPKEEASGWPELSSKTAESLFDSLMKQWNYISGLEKSNAAKFPQATEELNRALGDLQQAIYTNVRTEVVMSNIKEKLDMAVNQGEDVDESLYRWVKGEFEHGLSSIREENNALLLTLLPMVSMARQKRWWEAVKGVGLEALNLERVPEDLAKTFKWEDVSGLSKEKGISGIFGALGAETWKRQDLTKKIWEDIKYVRSRDIEEAIFTERLGTKAFAKLRIFDSPGEIWAEFLDNIWERGDLKILYGLWGIIGREGEEGRKAMDSVRMERLIKGFVRDGNMGIVREVLLHILIEPFWRAEVVKATWEVAAKSAPEAVVLALRVAPLDGTLDADYNYPLSGMKMGKMGSVNWARLSLEAVKPMLLSGDKKSREKGVAIAARIAPRRVAAR